MNARHQPSPEILFFSRGLGRGHAVPDSAIAQEVVNARPNTAIAFCSYSIGAVTLKDLGHDVIDLGLPEETPFPDAVAAATAVLQDLKPRLIVSHEEFAVPAIAHGFGISNVFITDWFANPSWPIMQSLKFANEIIFLDQPGYNEIPQYLEQKVYFAGYAFRELQSLPRSEARAQLGIPMDATVILVVSGGSGFHSEERAPVADLILKAFRAFGPRPKRLLWVVGDPDHDILSEKSHGQEEVVVLRPHAGLTSTMVASDLVLTKGNRTPLLECETLGIPTISLSSGYNQIDDLRNSRIPTNRALRSGGLTFEVLLHHIEQALLQSGSHPAWDTEAVSSGRRNAAKRICMHLESACRK